MTTRYAQASAAWASANWNEAADGSGASGDPQPGDYFESNGYNIDCADIDFAGMYAQSMNGGMYWSSKWYAQCNTSWATSTNWNSYMGGTGLTASNYTGNLGPTPTLSANNHWVDMSAEPGVVIDYTGWTLIEDGGKFVIPISVVESLIANVVFPSVSSVAVIEGTWGLNYDRTGTLDPSVKVVVSGFGGGDIAFNGEWLKNGEQNGQSTYRSFGTSYNNYLMYDAGAWKLFVSSGGDVSLYWDGPASTDPTGEYTREGSGSLAVALPGGTGYTYGSEDPSQVTTTATGAGTLDMADYVLATDVATLTEAAAINQLAADVVVVEANKASFPPETTILGVQGTAPEPEGGVIVRIQTVGAGLGMG